MTALEVFRERPPFPYYGGKYGVAKAVWCRLGAVRYYIEPFGGSAGVLLGRPTKPTVEILGDACGYVSNFWRAAQSAPQEVARHAYFPPSQIDLNARKEWIMRRAAEMDLGARLRADPEWYDAKLAAWWAWGKSLWIGSGWCRELADARPHIDGGVGLFRRPTSVADYLADLIGRVESGQPSRWEENLRNYVLALARRLERVTLFHGDWRGCVDEGVLNRGRHRRYATGAFLDPPYDRDRRDKGLYGQDRPGLAKEVWKWAVENGDDPLLRIALCGLEGEHRMPPAWEALPWKNKGGVEGSKDKERIWFSPSCLRANAPTGPNVGGN